LPSRVTGSSDPAGLAGSSPAHVGCVGPSPKNKKIKNKKCVCMNKNNVNLLVYSLTPESGIKIPV